MTITNNPGTEVEVNVDLINVAHSHLDVHERT